MRARLRPLFPVAVLVVALWARLAPWPHVFGGGPPALLGDSDAHYHVLRAERMLLGAPGAPWRDPSLNWPFGADVPWPPLFDVLIVGAARLVAGPMVERDAIVAAAAFVPFALGLLLVLLTASLGRRLLGARAGWIAALVVGAVAAGVDPSRLGRTDQHVLETLLFVALLVASVPAARPAATLRRDAALAATVVALAFWAWMGSGLHLVLVAAIAATLQVVPADEDDPGAPARAAAILAAAGLGGALLLALSVAVLGRDGALASSSLEGVGGLHVALAAATGAFGALLLAARRRWPAAGTRGRVAAVVGAAAIPGALLLALPSVRAGIGTGMQALAAGNSWYAAIDEFRPLLDGIPGTRARLVMLLRGYGLTFFVLPLAVAALVRAWRRRAAPRASLCAIAVLLVVLVPATWARRRFGPYAIFPLALATEVAIREGADLLLRRLGAASRFAGWVEAATVAAAFAVVLPAFPEHGLADPVLPAEKIAVLRWVATRPTEAGREAVLAPWAEGHAIQYFAGRPVVTSPFGTAGGDGAMRASAAFWHATDQAAALHVLEIRRVGLVLLGPVIPEIATLQGFAAPAPIAIAGAEDGRNVDAWQPTDRLWALVPTRLYYDAGSLSPDGPALDRFRLLSETSTTSPENPAGEERWMLFEPVDGARVRVAGAGGAVSAAITLVTDAGRTLEWTTAAERDERGVATLRLPYASGRNGAVWARAWRIRAGDVESKLVLHEDDVRTGRTIAVELAAASAAARLTARQQPQER